MKAVARYGFFTMLVAFLIAFLVQGAGADEMKGKKEKKVYPALEAPADSAGQAHNSEGVAAYNQKEWESAEDHFRSAINADGNLAQAHYNLALTLDMQGKHKDAAMEFDKALKLAPNDTAIADSPILKRHLERMKK
ncbi:MAG TPA: tetratricopeptide repeat protein [Nitrospiria bacterium]|nr:tetratricopeptide repeat protein [Nitrospiria bacterium]